MHSSIRVWNRTTSAFDTEQVFGESILRFLYEHPWGRPLGKAVVGNARVSQLYGAYQSSWLSRRAIPGFIRQFRIPMKDYEPGPFASFNDFFARRLAPGARAFASVPDRMPAFAEARYLAFSSMTAQTQFPIKGMHLSLGALLGSESRAKVFENGPLFIARLCPTDYHRFHFPDDGRVVEQAQIPGRFESVSPIALRQRGDILFRNERQLAILETAHFGTLAYIEVGAFCVGRIVQTHPSSEFSRGAEKGYFLFGASTVVVAGTPGAFRPDQDLLDKTSEGVETLVRLGEPIASAGDVRQDKAVKHG